MRIDFHLAGSALVFVGSHYGRDDEADAYQCANGNKREQTDPRKKSHAPTRRGGRNFFLVCTAPSTELAVEMYMLFDYRRGYGRGYRRSGLNNWSHLKRLGRFGHRFDYSQFELRKIIVDGSLRDEVDGRAANRALRGIARLCFGELNINATRWARVRKVRHRLMLSYQDTFSNFICITV